MSIRWRSDAPPNLVKLAVGRCMAAVMDAGKWIEIGLLTDTQDQISNHSRLLRSLRFGDDDYDSHVHSMVSVVLGERRMPTDPWDVPPAHVDDRPQSAFPNLDLVAEFLDLPAWLAQNDSTLFERLFIAEETSTMPDGTVLSAAEAAAARLQVGEMRRQIERIRRDHADDPEAAIGQAKELVETTCKTILGLTGDGAETKEDVPKLVKQTLIHLGLDPASVQAAGGDLSEARALQRLLGGISSILSGTAELRNARGTGHGKSGAPLVDAALARLTVGLVLPAIVYLLEVYDQRTGPGLAQLPPPTRADPKDLRVGSIVVHDSFGEGQVRALAGEGQYLTTDVDFGAIGIKTLLVRYAPLKLVTP